MKKIYYPNCSELIADFSIHDSKEFYEMVKRLGKKYDWEFQPKLTIELLEAMKKDDGMSDITIKVLDKKGNYTTIEYGNNGYDSELGFRFDSGCNHSDNTQYNFFDKAIKDCRAEIRSYDGGSTDYFEEWQEKNEK